MFSVEKDIVQFTRWILESLWLVKISIKVNWNWALELMTIKVILHS